MHLNFLVYIIQHTLTFHGLFYYVHMHVDKEALLCWRNSLLLTCFLFSLFLRWRINKLHSCCYSMSLAVLSWSFHILGTMLARYMLSPGVHPSVHC